MLADHQSVFDNSSEHPLSCDDGPPSCDDGSHHHSKQIETLSPSEESGQDEEKDYPRWNIKQKRTFEKDHSFREGDVRRGKWTAEEQAYADRLVRDFEAGLLPLENGATLRAYLSRKLNCDPMRISKKFAGNKCLGKQVFQRRSGEGSDSAASSSSMYTSSMAPLTMLVGVRDDEAVKALEEDFHRSIASAAANKKSRTRNRTTTSFKTEAFTSNSITLATNDANKGGATSVAAKVHCENLTPDGSIGSALTLALHGAEMYSELGYGKVFPENSWLGAVRTNHHNSLAAPSCKTTSTEEGGTSESSCSDSDFFSNLAVIYKQPKRQTVPAFEVSQNAGFFGEITPYDDSGDCLYFEKGQLGSSSEVLNLFNLYDGDGEICQMDEPWIENSFNGDGGGDGTISSLGENVLEQLPISSASTLPLLDGNALLDNTAPKSTLPVARHVSFQGVLSPNAPRRASPAESIVASARNARKMNASVGGSSSGQTTTIGILQQVLLPAALEPLGEYLPDECFSF